MLGGREQAADTPNGALQGLEWTRQGVGRTRVGSEATPAIAGGAQRRNERGPWFAMALARLAPVRSTCGAVDVGILLHG